MGILQWAALLPLLFCGTAATELTTSEFCNMEAFNATCASDQILLFHGARYGRMKRGRCVKRNLGYLGCAVDVLTYLDQRCSGRRTCSFDMPDPVLYETHPCPEDTTPYLEVSYECIGVVPREPRQCHSGQPLAVTQSSGYLSTTASVQKGHGTALCPWHIVVSPGQRINLTVYNFQRGPGAELGAGAGAGQIEGAGEAARDGGGGDGSPVWPQALCYEYATLTDGDARRRVTVCGGDRRQKNFYFSNSNSVQIQVDNANVLQTLGPFLIRFEAVGCPDVPAPQHGFASRERDVVKVGCNASSEVWYLTCRGSKWLGKVGNCSFAVSSANVHSRDSGFPFGILIVVSIGVALGVFLGGLLLVLAVIYMKRRQRRRELAYREQMMRDPLQERKVAMLYQMHPDSPEWDHVTKSLDSDDTLLKDTSYQQHQLQHQQRAGGGRACSVPYCDQRQVMSGGTLPPPGSSGDKGVRNAKTTGPGDVPCPYTGADSICSNVSRQHIYECPKFS